jgi:ribosome maturation factor RimP
VRASEKQIFLLLEPTVTALGLELWGIEHLSQGRRSVLRVYIDNPAGVTIDDCERVSRQVSGILDVEDPIAGEYTLEVSSPGLDRRLFTEAQVGRYIGESVSIKLGKPLGGRRNFSGRIINVADGNVVIMQDDNEISLPFSEIDKAQLVL